MKGLLSRLVGDGNTEAPPRSSPHTVGLSGAGLTVAARAFSPLWCPGALVSSALGLSGARLCGAGELTPPCFEML